MFSDTSLSITSLWDRPLHVHDFILVVIRFEPKDDDDLLLQIDDREERSFDGFVRVVVVVGVGGGGGDTNVDCNPSP